MNDRELLELAAKAAGISGVFVARYAADGYPHDFVGIGRNSATIAPLWNPLTDAGDALRLAFELGMTVDMGAMIIVFGDDPSSELEFDNHDGNIANVRRAIVRAAAEIGRAMS